MSKATRKSSILNNVINWTSVICFLRMYISASTGSFSAEGHSFQLFTSRIFSKMDVVCLDTSHDYDKLLSDPYNP